ncbi:nucleotidyltransferase domain-containing protein [Pelotomaculum terephthalicicum JT]|uniref:nucleotidyltransferase domain-containing protein n=1 Tax=Pelotomaculum terephthalicicum TaxID=206393 RepID=UPI0009D01141|nr:nucleotidyltransferase domain-containing protein [Pelotomaculum terephthalicicum]MCG9966568.1 nucleotidyltransferase domain-containing protein [Pelotomaculum terephthalicicum JT]OPY63506.1 MAG: Nucleotidyltransferase domain protein [Pelotomaculum sp. PtaU1.Bin065]
MPKATNKIANIVKSYLLVLEKKGVPLQKAYLFGSQTKGTARPYSDIDLIVVSPVFAGMPQWKRWEILGDALAEVMEPIDVRGYAPDEISQGQKDKASFIYEVLTEPETITI